MHYLDENTAKGRDVASAINTAMNKELYYLIIETIIKVFLPKTDKSVASFDRGKVSNSKQATSKRQTCY